MPSLDALLQRLDPGSVSRRASGCAIRPLSAPGPRPSDAHARQRAHPPGLARRAPDDARRIWPTCELRRRPHGGWPRRTSTCSAWAAAVSAPRCCATCRRPARTAPQAHGPRHDRRAHDSAGHRALAPAARCFIVASKSGATIEVTSLERHFWTWSRRARIGQMPGRHFVAITDPDTSLVSHARGRAATGKRFINPPDIGGRYSALSLFGLVPGALLGVDVAALLACGRAMASQCHADRRGQSGPRARRVHGRARAGRTRQAHAARRRRRSRRLGPWIEQLVAESTGKDGRGVLPVVGEPVGKPDEYGDDRAFVAIVADDADSDLRHRGDDRAAGHPVFRIEIAPGELGAEFFRWEFATAVAGAALGINPFDEPNVRDAKLRTQTQLDARRAHGAFRIDPPFERGRRATRAASTPAAAGLTPARLRRDARLSAGPSRGASRPSTALRAALRAAHAASPRPTASARDTCTRPVSTTRAGPTPGSFLLLTAADDDARRRCPAGRLHVQRAEIRAGARRFRRARRGRPRTSSTTTSKIRRADYSAALESVLRSR